MEAITTMSWNFQQTFFLEYRFRTVQFVTIFGTTEESFGENFRAETQRN
jgi:hypothetical protein